MYKTTPTIASKKQRPAGIIAEPISFIMLLSTTIIMPRNKKETVNKTATYLYLLRKHFIPLPILSNFSLDYQKYRQLYSVIFICHSLPALDYHSVLHLKNAVTQNRNILCIMTCNHHRLSLLQLQIIHPFLRPSYHKQKRSKYEKNLEIPCRSRRDSWK